MTRQQLADQILNDHDPNEEVSYFIVSGSDIQLVAKQVHGTELSDDQLTAITFALQAKSALVPEQISTIVDQEISACLEACA